MLVMLTNLLYAGNFKRKFFKLWLFWPTVICQSQRTVGSAASISAWVQWAGQITPHSVIMYSHCSIVVEYLG